MPCAGSPTYLRGWSPLLPDSVAHAVLVQHRVEIPLVIGRRPDLDVKPAPDQLLAACELLEVAPDMATMIGDSTWDLQAARAAGCHFIGVTNGMPNEFPPGVPVAGSLDQAVMLVG